MVSAVVKRPTPPGTSRLTEGIGAMHVIKALQACHVPINLDLVTEQRSGSQPWVSQVSRGLMDGVEASGGRGQGEPHPPTPTPPWIPSARQETQPAKGQGSRGFSLPIHAGMLQGHRLHPHLLALVLVANCRSSISTVSSQLGFRACLPIREGLLRKTRPCSAHTGLLALPGTLHPTSAPRGRHTFSGSICPGEALWSHLSVQRG